MEEAKPEGSGLNGALYRCDGDPPASHFAKRFRTANA